jgi:hypothetical protein
VLVRKARSGKAVPITAADIALYRRYDGDLDGLCRSADRSALTSEAGWRTLDDLRQRAFIAARQGGSKTFERELESDLDACMADQHALIAFQLLVAADLDLVANRERESSGDD